MRLFARLQRAARVPVVADPMGDDEKIILLAGHDGTLTMLAGLLGLNWHLPGYAVGEAAPGGALLFELWRSGTNGQQTIRIYYVAQSLDQRIIGGHTPRFGQLRYLAPLSPEQPPEIATIAVPGCGDAGRGCPLSGFTAHILRQVGPGDGNASRKAAKGSASPSQQP